MSESRRALAGLSWVLTAIGSLWALIVFMGTSWNGVRQHKIETPYLYAIPLPAVAAILAGALLCSGWRHSNAARHLSSTLPVLLWNSLTVVVAICLCFGILR